MGDATKEYVKLHDQIMAKTVAIQGELFKRAGEVHGHIDWGHVGDLGHIAELLDGILTFLRGDED